MNVCLLVTTYKRNGLLLRLLGQIRNIRADYSGENHYAIWVADSDGENSEAAQISSLCDQRIVNPGQGFDANILNFYRNHSASFDYVLSISDDDLFSLCEPNPIYLIDAAIRSNKGVIFFNHVDFEEGGGKIILKSKYYSNPELWIGGRGVIDYFFRLLPRHVGIMYSTHAIKRTLGILDRFDQTFHLYAVPLLFGALENDILFVDYPLFYFSIDEKTGGAWEDGAQVFSGLVKFLKNLKPLIPLEIFETASDGFFKNYLGTQSWLRRDMEARGVHLPSELEVFNYLRS